MAVTRKGKAGEQEWHTGDKVVANGENCTVQEVKPTDDGVVLAVMSVDGKHGFDVHEDDVVKGGETLADVKKAQIMEARLKDPKKYGLSKEAVESIKADAAARDEAADAAESKKVKTAAPPAHPGTGHKPPGHSGR